MIYAGCDIGSLTSKAVILKDGKIFSHAVVLSASNPVKSSQSVIDAALQQTDLNIDDLVCIVGTGYGKNCIPFAHHTVSEITCHAKGAWWNVPSVRTVVDIGGQDAKAITLDDQGNVMQYVYNDKCASGTGRFLEVMADALEIKLDDMGTISAQAKEDIQISNQCVIFAESEVISLVNEGKDVADIIQGLHKAMARRAASLAKSIGVTNDVVFTGGVAKNKGVAKALSESLEVNLVALSIDPQINGALGAALIASEYKM